MSKAKALFTNFRMILLIIVVLLAIVAIHPVFDGGVAVRSVSLNSSAYNVGMRSPEGNVWPTQKEAITQMDTTKISNINDYDNFMKSKIPGQKIQIRTTKGLYSVDVPENGNIGLKVYNRPTNNLKRGLDISGGTRVILKPAIPENSNISDEERKSVFEITAENIEKRLNVYGLTELSVRVINDKPAILGGMPTYISVEIAGADEEEVIGLLSSQGKFEATIKNQTVFLGGERDITYICKTADCSGIDPYKPCGTLSDGSGNTMCRFRFSIALSSVAAQRFASITSEIDEITDENGQKRLTDNINFYLDEKLTDSLTIDGSLKGKVSTNIEISGSGVGKDEQEATKDALKRMREMQSVLISGSLPYKLTIVNTNLVSPTLGSNFLKNVLFVGSIAILIVALLIFIRYRVIAVVIPIILTLVFEIILLLGMTSILGATLDIAAIAGIIITIGTGTNDQIVMIDEILKNRNKKVSESSSFLGSLKNAFFVIFSAYAVIVVAMIPLLWSGAGLLKGFAITTIIGATMGVLITRPAFAKVIEILLE